MKRTPMPRPSKPPERNTPLARTGRLERRTRIKIRSDKTRAVYEVRRELVASLLAARTWCEIRWDDGCQGRAVDVHEPRTRARHQTDICDETECVTACRWCHDQAHAHPAEAQVRGWLIPSGRPSRSERTG